MTDMRATKWWDKPLPDAIQRIIMGIMIVTLVVFVTSAVAGFALFWWMVLGAIR